ncbi:TetR/AcrR family transcriptional regulator [Fodinicola acaciae]|uniref:TetR/AcrR family transcriptional regulator n=1 Tax=Fodinicola acaciae TaxID=2681555 RepID=UPI0013D7444E|nr:TetR/AcrR family transcriptional regulator [Fodinicola acaciae]
MAEQRHERADAARNRVAILRATEELLSAHPAEEVSIDRVAAAAGVGKGTVFRRFGDRYGLMRALVMQRAAALEQAFTSGPPPLGPGATPAERLTAFLDAALDLVSRNSGLIAAHERAAVAGKHHEQPVYQRWHQHVTELIAEARPDLDADLQAHILLRSLSDEVVIHLIRNGQAERFGRTLHDLAALLTAKRP